MCAGVLLPATGLLVEPYILVWLGALLFLNLIRLDAPDLLATFTKPRRVAVLSAVKLFALPLGLRPDQEQPENYQHQAEEDERQDFVYHASAPARFAHLVSSMACVVLLEPAPAMTGT